MPPHKFRRGDLVRYTSNSGTIIQAIVLASGPKMSTVEARFTLDAKGQRVPGYLGFTFYLATAHLTPEPDNASVKPGKAKL